MAKLVFLKRTPKEIEIFGGDVFFDIDGKNEGMLSLSNRIIEVPAGEHKIKMYKSHTFDTFIGFAESTVAVTEDEELMIKYSAPMMINQPGNMVISAYSKQEEESALKEREYVMNRDFVNAETQKKQADENYKNGVKIVLLVTVGIAVVFGIYYGILLSSF